MEKAPSSAKGPAMASSALVTLFVLTAMSGGGYSTAYTTKPDMETCKASVPVVKEILTNGGVEVTSIQCLMTEQSLTQFKHRPPKGALRYPMLNIIKGDRLIVTQTASMEICKAKRVEAKSAGQIAHCSTSKQKPEQ